MPPLVVADTACLIGLERIERLDVLPRVFPDIAVPPVVRDELGYAPSWLQVIAVRDRSFLAMLRTKLDPGEAGVIALAREQAGAIALVDEKKARRIAEQHGVRVIGTAGVLLRAKREGTIPQVRPLLDALVRHGFRLSGRLYAEVVRLAGEDAMP